MTEAFRKRVQKAVKFALKFAEDHYGRPPSREEVSAASGLKDEAALVVLSVLAAMGEITSHSIEHNASKSMGRFVDAVNAFYKQHGRWPTAEEGATLLGVDVSYFYERLHKARKRGLLPHWTPVSRIGTSYVTVVRFVECFRAEHGRDPGGAEIGRAMGFSKQRGHQLLQRMRTEQRTVTSTSCSNEQEQ